MYLTQQYSVYFRNGFPPFIAWISVALFSCCCASATPSRYGHSVVYLSGCFLLRFSSCARLEPGVYYPVLSLVCYDSGTMSFILSTILLPLGVHLQIISIHIFCFTTLVYGRPKTKELKKQSSYSNLISLLHPLWSSLPLPEIAARRVSQGISTQMQTFVGYKQNQLRPRTVYVRANNPPSAG